MPISYLSSLTAAQRSARSDLHMGALLALNAGALNAGGLLAIGQYTSHMTGMLSSAADDLVLGRWPLALAAFGSIAAFTAGAASTAVLVNYAKRRHAANYYAPSLLIEALLLLVFGVAGAYFPVRELAGVSLIAMLLCFVMGLQNALITKISNADIRTTHVTGLLTDIGIELGKLSYWRGHEAEHAVVATVNRVKLRRHCLIVACFFIGGVGGAAGFKAIGFLATIPLALVLVTLALAPVLHRRGAD